MATGEVRSTAATPLAPGSGRQRPGYARLASLLAVLSAAAAAAEIEVSAGDLAYEIAGEGPVVVLLHGSNLDHRMWNREAEVLRFKARVVRYDLRGHGSSEIPQAPFSPIEDLRDLLDELGIASAKLVGLSAGSQIAIDFALAYPERVEAMLLAAPGLSGYRPPEMPPIFRQLMEKLRAGDYAGANQVMLDSPFMAVPEESRELVAEMVGGNERLWTIPPQYVQAPPRPAIDHLGELKMPIVVAVGENDVADIRRQAELLAANAPGARLEVIHGGGHLLNLTSPAAFTELLAELLGR